MKACRICGAPARIRWAPGNGRAKPAEDTPGGKWAVLAWNSGANQKINRIGGTI